MGSTGRLRFKPYAIEIPAVRQQRLRKLASIGKVSVNAFNG